MKRPTPSLVISIAALLVALGSGAYAATQVTSKTVKDNTLKSKDLKNEKAVTGKDIAADSVEGTDIAEATLSGVVPGGAAGGALQGSFPNPALAPATVGANEVIDDSIGDADVDEASLGLRDSGIVTVSTTAPELIRLGPFTIGGSCPGGSATLGVTTSRDNSTRVSNYATGSVGDADFDPADGSSFLAGTGAVVSETAGAATFTLAAPDGSAFAGVGSAVAIADGVAERCRFRVQAIGD